MGKETYKVSDKTTAKSTTFVVESNFGHKDWDVHTVTLVLGASRFRGQGNTFYDKHVLRRGEDPQKILGMRRATSNAGYDPELASDAHAFGIKSTGAPASTVIVLDRIDLKLMLYEMAKGLVAANDAGTFATLNTNFHVEVSFSVANCVCTASPGAAVTKGNKIKLGAQLQARNDAALDYLFEVNHCDG